SVAWAGFDACVPTSDCCGSHRLGASASPRILFHGNQLCLRLSPRPLHIVSREPREPSASILVGTCDRVAHRTGVAPSNLEVADRNETLEAVFAAAVRHSMGLLF